jgi:hypothetical protein
MRAFPTNVSNSPALALLPGETNSIIATIRWSLTCRTLTCRPVGGTMRSAFDSICAFGSVAVATPPASLAPP